MSENIDAVAEQAATEWDYTESESQFDRPPMSVSIPCQLRFTEPPERDVDRFNEALSVHGYEPLASNPTKDHESPYYESEICSTEHYNRVKILVFRSNVVRLYPHDEYVPTTEELAELLHALTVGFKSALEHDPIDTEGSGE